MVPGQTSYGSSGRPSSGSWPCPPAGSSSHPPRGSRRIGCRLQTERNTCLKAEEQQDKCESTLLDERRRWETLNPLSVCLTHLCISCPDRWHQSSQPPSIQKRTAWLKTGADSSVKRLEETAAREQTLPRRSPLLKGWYGMSLNFSGTAQGPHPEGLSWITGALNLAMA